MPSSKCQEPGPPAIKTVASAFSLLHQTLDLVTSGYHHHYDRHHQKLDTSATFTPANMVAFPTPLSSCGSHRNQGLHGRIRWLVSGAWSQACVPVPGQVEMCVLTFSLGRQKRKFSRNRKTIPKTRHRKKIKVLVIPFKNVFYQTVTFSFIVENPAFSIRAVDSVQPKKVNNVTVYFEGNPSGSKTPITSKLIVACPPGEGRETGVKWVYYLKGITV